MSFPLSVTRGVQLGLESTAGTSVPAAKRLLGTSIVPEAKGEIGKFMPTGYLFNTIAVPGKEWTESKIDGAPAYNDLIYLLSGLIGGAAPVRNIPSTGLSYTWTFTPSSTQIDSPKTFTVEEGDAVYAEKFSYGMLSELSLQFDPMGAQKLSGTMLGQRLTEAIAMTASPTEIALVPILGTQVDVYLDSTAGAIGTTKLTRDFNASFKLGGRQKGVFTLDSAAPSFAALAQQANDASIELELAHDSVGQALTTLRRTGGTRFVRIKATGAIIETIYPYSLQIDAAVQITEIPGKADQDGVYTRKWKMTPMHDPTFGKAVTVSVTGIVATL